jgi:carboxymethylenebutenolidase
MSGNFIQISVDEKTARAYLSLPPGGKGPGVMVLHAWWGLKPFFQEFCDRLAEQGFTVLAPDLYYGEVAHTIEEAKALMEKSDPQVIGNTVMTAKDALLAHPACASQQLGLVGFSMGGSWSLITAAYAPEQVGAVVLFYGVGEADFGKIQAKVLGHFSDVDEWETMEWVELTERNLRATGVDVTFHIYPRLAHWFFESDRPEYDPAASALSFDRTIAFLKENL